MGHFEKAEHRITELDTSLSLDQKYDNDKATQFSAPKKQTPFIPPELRLMIYKHYRTYRAGGIVNIRQAYQRQTLREWQRQKMLEPPPKIIPDNTNSCLPSQSYESKSNLLAMMSEDQVRYLAFTWFPRGHRTPQVFLDTPLLGFKCVTPIKGIAMLDLPSLGYERVFACGALSVPETWFNFEYDTLYLRHDTFSHTRSAGMRDFIEALGTGNRGDWSRVRKLAILWAPLSPENHLGELSDLRSILRYFPVLEKFTFVDGHYTCGPDDDSPLCFVEPMDYDDQLYAYCRTRIPRPNRGFTSWSLGKDWYSSNVRLKYRHFDRHNVERDQIWQYTEMLSVSSGTGPNLERRTRVQCRVPEIEVKAIMMERRNEEFEEKKKEGEKRSAAAREEWSFIFGK